MLVKHIGSELHILASTLFSIYYQNLANNLPIMNKLYVIDNLYEMKIMFKETYISYSKTKK